MKYKLITVLLALLAMSLPGCTLPFLSSGSGASDVPRAWFDVPLPGTIFTPPSPCQIVGHGASPNGIAAFELSINGEASSIPSPDTQSSLVTLTRDCGLSNPGTYLLRLRAQDKAGNWSGYAETSLIIPGGTTTETPAAACEDKLDVTLEDPLQKAQMLPGQSFTKKWTVQNMGTCTWDRGYHFVFVGGPSMSEGAASMGAPLDIPLSSMVSIPVAPGQKITIPLGQTAPMADGWYVGAWNLVDPNGSKTPITYGGTTMPSLYVDIVVKGITATLTPTVVPTGSVSIESISGDLIYIGQASCGSLDVTITARAIAPKGIAVVVLFYRFEPGSPSGFENVAMNPIGGDLYQYTLNPTSLFGGSIPFDQATLQYQIVVQQKDGDISLRTPVMANIAVQACGNVTACSSYTDKRSCQSHGCKWALQPGLVPVYACQSP